MVDSSEADTLAILTFWVGPFLLGVEADQIAQLTRPSGQRLSIHASDVASDLKVMDLRSACGLPRETDEERRQLLVVDRAGEKVGYRVDRVGELITIDISMYIWPLPPLLEIQKRWRQLWGVCQGENELVLLEELEETMRILKRVLKHLMARPGRLPSSHIDAISEVQLNAVTVNALAPASAA